MEENTKRVTVLIIGRTGNGKSTLANVISGTNNFKESEFGVSETKNYQKESFEVEPRFHIAIVDTIGIGDTQLSTQEVLYKIADACYSIRDGINQVLFVSSGRFTEEEILAYDLLRSVIFNNDIIRYTTIVRTKFSPFRNPDKCAEDIKRMSTENQKMSAIFSTCRKVIHVNNLTAEEDPELKARQDSRTRLLMHLRSCVDIYRPVELKELNERIGSYMTEKERLEENLKEINQKLQERDKLTVELRNQLQQEKLAGETRVEALKSEVAKQTGKRVREKSPGIFELIGGTLDNLIKAPKRCVLF